MLSSRRRLSVKKQTPSQQERQSPGGVTALTSKTGGNLEPSSYICGCWKLALEEEGNGGGGQKVLAGVLGGCGGESRGRLEFSSAQSARKAIFAGAPGR